MGTCFKILRNVHCEYKPWHRQINGKGWLRWSEVCDAGSLSWASALGRMARTARVYGVKNDGYGIFFLHAFLTTSLGGRSPIRPQRD